MYSAHDLLAEGFPHSDIRGSTIARISPRLFAACHVLHRLLAPRHPPNALITLIHHQHPHAGPRPTRDACQWHQKMPSISHSHSHNQPIRFTCQTTRPQRTPRLPAQAAPAANPLCSNRRARTPEKARTLHPVSFTPWRRSDSNRRPPACKAGALPLSYAPANLKGHKGLSGAAWWAREDLNLRPHAYQACALTN
jgi:hypothetical protein